MRPLALTFALFCAASTLLLAEVREWTSADGSQTFEGEYVSHDSAKVTIRRKDGKVFTMELARLNAGDKIWLSDKQPTDKPAPKQDPAPGEDPKAVFDTLCFGDKREDVTRKLKESALMESTLDEELMGRVGFNGSYHTRKKIGGLTCSLYLEFTGGGTLKEISLQTDAVPKEVYVNRLKAPWQELADLMTALHGKPVTAGSLPGIKSLQPGSFSPSHLWKIAGGGSALLGTSVEGDTCMIVVRFTTERIQPVAAP